MSKVEKTDDCWLWTKASDADGYGLFMKDNRLHRAHRVSWELHNGPIPGDLLVCHHCDNPRCVNPSHLFLGTARDNNRDMMRKGRYRQGNTSATAARGDRNAMRRYPDCVPRGEQHPDAKLTEPLVREIRARHAAGASQLSLAGAFHMGRSQIGRIVRGESWRHIA